MLFVQVTAFSLCGFRLDRACGFDSQQQHIASAGFELARRYCSRCHGEGSYQGSAKFSIIDPESLIKEKYVVVGDPDASALWQRLQEAEMPPENQPQPTDDERTLFKEWIAIGAPKPDRPPRDFRSEQSTLGLIEADLAKLDSRQRAFTRYFSMTHLHNNSHGISDFDLRYYRAALAKALNSLSWEHEMIELRAIDTEATLFAIDLRALGWDEKDWDALLETYPYGLRFDRSDNDQLANVASRVRELCGSSIAHIRCDWFTVFATRPPLYHRLLDLPATDRELEDQLGVDVDQNFLDGKVIRAGFAESGVSVSNRLVERHPSKFGFYWKSYDFRRSNGTGSLFQFPLGPTFRRHPFPDFAFAQDGGEIIFSLPNGLQGYLLVDGRGQRIDAGPIEVVRDLKETSGTPVVVNGISCMHCHQSGMIDFRDSVRDGMAVFGDVRRKSLELFKPADEMDKLLAKDRRQFLQALEPILKKWLAADGDDRTSVDNTGEPIATVTRFYGGDISLEIAAFELGLSDPAELAAAIKNNPKLRRLGLGPLLQGQRIDRQVWENRDVIVSPMQHTAREMNLATPYVMLTNP